MKYLLPALLLLCIGAVVLSTSFRNTDSNADNGGNEAFIREIGASTGKWEENAQTAIFDNQQVTTLSRSPEENAILSYHTAADGSEKWIEVDLSDFKLVAWEGNRKVYEFATSTGRPGYKTPPGEYRVWRKVLSQRYRGGIPGTSSYYNLPNVPYSLFFYKGYAIHGAYWHNDFGIKNRSSGCVNLHPDNARLIYEWAAPSMPVGVNALNSTAENHGIRVLVHE